MKKIIPFKWIVLSLIFFLILPLSIAITLFIAIENKSQPIVVLLFFLFGIPIPILIYVISMNLSVSIDIETGEVKSEMHNMHMFSWTKHIKNAVKEIYVSTDISEISKLGQHQFKPKKVLVIVFKNQEKQAIPLTLFTEKQIRKMINLLNEANINANNQFLDYHKINCLAMVEEIVTEELEKEASNK
ncbi:MAG: hypothetical protein FWE36_08005 [Erysipelotrichales bacterium]|nr:hypothetical protein [Erysipelotrichales bacterium]